MSSFVVFFLTFLSFVCVTFFGIPVEASFSDTSDHQYEDAIQYLQNKAIVTGYEDGSFHPNGTIGRAEFIKILVNVSSADAILEYTGGNCFNDISQEQWWKNVACFAKDRGIVSGYEDGSFQPHKAVTLAEASKMIVNTLIAQTEPVDSTLWYNTFFEILDQKKALPPSIGSWATPLKRGEMAEMVWRIQEQVVDKESKSIESLKVVASSAVYDHFSLAQVDTNKVMDFWLQKHNGQRSVDDPRQYVFQLNETAQEWAEHAASQGYIDHKRPGQTAYYDYPKMVQWFADRGITFQSGPNPPFSESIAWYPYSCDSGDCTQEVIDILKYTFNWYMAEAGKSWAPHYNSIVNSKFHVMGLGIALGHGKLFVTTHYGTNLE